MNGIDYINIFIIHKYNSILNFNLTKKKIQMMHQLMQEFTIHPVGQGLFYSGKILYKNKVKFRMIFDCGSLTSGAGQEEVENYRDSDFLNEKIIDLLVISHFDADHVNQIGKLLDGNIKVKRLVMPFLTFEERLVLVLHQFSDRSVRPEDDFFIRFAIDPLGTIDENLDGDSEVILIETSPNNPIDRGPNINDGFLKLESDKPEDRFEVIFSEKKEIKSGEDKFIFNSKVKIFKMDDSKKGIVVDRYLQLMDFLFYRKKTTSDERAFYDEIAKRFYEKYNIDSLLQKDELLSKTIDQIKKIKSSTEIKKMFRTAKKETGVVGIGLEDLNTTALSLFHRNLPDILKLGEFPYRNSDNFFLYSKANVYTIHKFIGSRIETPSLNLSRNWRFRIQEDDFPFIFPNVLLTSDSFLLKKTDIDPFLKHYENYWDSFWLFQIPHHGSDKNSDGVLHSHLTSIQSCFINYGMGNRDNHPSSSIIYNLVATGNSSKIVPVNQVLGLRFVLAF